MSWYHNITLIQKCSSESERLWYAQKALENGWSRNVMVMQIETELYTRSGKVVTNFDRALPNPQSDMARQALKDPCIFDFLALDGTYREKELEDNLVPENLKSKLPTIKELEQELMDITIRKGDENTEG